MALTQILTTDSVSASTVNTKIVDPANTAISGLQIAQTAGGTGTAITLTGIELTNGYQKTFVISASNSGAATTINGKPLYKPGTTVSPNLTVGKAATVWYNLVGDCFFIKASTEGTATAGDVLAGVTFSNDDDIGTSGTLSLTGDATIADVKTGKTFYNTDAKTKLTGVNIDKKWASGTGISSSASLLFYYSSGSSVSYRYLEVSGLTFTPSSILVYSENGVANPQSCILYPENLANPLSIGCRILTTNTPNATNTATSVARAFQLDGVSAYVSPSGFRMPLEFGSENMRWTAFE